MALKPDIYRDNFSNRDRLGFYAEVQKKNALYKREGKDRLGFLGDRIASIPCRASYFAPGRFEE